MSIIDGVRPVGSPLSPGDLRHVGAGQLDRPELDEGQDDANDSVADHHGHDVFLELVLQSNFSQLSKVKQNSEKTGPPCLIKNIFYKQCQ